jgi:transposase
MENKEIIWKLLEIDLKKYKITEYKENKERNIMVFWVKSKTKFCLCPSCGIKTDKRQDLKEYKQKKTLKHINISNNVIVEIRPIKRYFRCVSCGNEFLEKFDFESPNGFHTTYFENYVISSFGYLSWNTIAQLNKTSPKKNI